MQALNLPSYTFRMIEEDGVVKIYDSIRKKYLVLQAEEWVRQHFTKFLLEEKKVPRGFINNEITLKLNGMNKRCDAVVYSPQGKALAILEYKAPNVALTQETFNQIARYNLRLQVPFLIISNGLVHYCCTVNYKTQTVQFISYIPTYLEMLQQLNGA